MRRLFLTAIAALTLICTEAQANRIALIQAAFEWGDTDANIAAFDSKIQSIDGCDMIIMPELFISGCDMRRGEKEIKDSVKREVAALYPTVIETMQRWASQSSAVVIGSTIFEQDGLFYNRLLAVYPSGEYHIYDKHNCFKMGAFSPGSDHLVITVNGHRYATYICYDIRFEEWSKNDGRYDSAIYIANWPESRSDDWNEILRERAVENNAYVIGVNCVGVDPAGISYIGESALYLPDGTLKAKCEEATEQILIVEQF